MVKLAGCIWESFVDAEGVSCVLFISGCKHNCYNCQSPQTHDFNYGIEIDDNVINYINENIDKRPYLNALVLSGGDPMYSAKELLPIINKLHIPNNNLWCYSGFTIAEIQNNSEMNKLLNMCSHLIDGPYQDEKRDVTLQFRGSSNQIVWQNNNGIWEKKYYEL